MCIFLCSFHCCCQRDNSYPSFSLMFCGFLLKAATVIWLVEVIYFEKKSFWAEKGCFLADQAPSAQLELISCPSPLLHQMNPDCGIRKEFAVLVTTSEVTTQLHCNERLLWSTVENENTTPSFPLPANKHLKFFSVK